MQLDVNNAFLNGDLFEEVYMDILQGYPIKGENLVCTRQWFQKFSAALTSHGFSQSKSDYFLFHAGSKDSFVAVLMNVDDIIVANKSPLVINQVQHTLQGLFKLKVIGDLRYFLGLEIAQSSRGIFISQRHYTLSLLKDTGFSDCKPATLPMDPNLKLNSIGGEPLADNSQYRHLIGCLVYLTISHPDISFAVNKLSQYMSKPRSPHLDALHHLLCYLKSSPG